MDTLNTQKKIRTKRPYNNVGKFFAKVRIDLNMATEDWAKTLNVGVLTLNEIERSDDKKLTLPLAKNIDKVIRTSAPQHLDEYANLVVTELGVLLIPEHATDYVIDAAADILEHGIEEVKGFTGTE